ncbi:MAG TPA: patatin-like phospholipase family protein [Puia sp.]|nr:patatin-like phospholipase family protein [Puia sp.]
MRYSSLFCIFLLLSLVGFAQNQATHRPKLGLTLSGGGAKGLAHIGILKAIDSAGLKIDYVTGTSMGAIIGALYAVGYSGDSIETITRKIDWDLVLSNQYPLRDIIMQEKSEYYKYVLELPWVNHWFRLSTGVLEAQELWIKFSELFFPVYATKKFDQYSIPFKCIGTDISSGEAVAIDSGEIISAVRASMAIPSLFTAVQYNGRKLVDGGIVRNFPVKDVKDMGADIVIGSNVANALLAGDKINNVVQVLLQIAFFREAEDTRKEVPLTDIYVPAHLEKYSMGSFGSAEDILQAGLEEGRQLYPRLKKLADSLDAIYGPVEKPRSKLPEVSSVNISSYEVNGNHHTTTDFIVQSTDILTQHYYTPKNLSRMVRRTAGTRYYNRVTYSLQPQPDSSCKIIFDVNENPLTFAKIGLHYNQFSGISAILNLTSRDFLTPNSRSLVTVNIGQNFRARAEHLQYFGRERNIAVTIAPQFEQFNITTYRNSKEAGLYDQQYFRADGRFGISTNRDVTLGVGTRYESIRYNPSLASVVNFSGSNHFTTSYFFIRQNTLDRSIYPKRGFKLDAEGDLVYAQHPGVTINSNGNISDTSVSRDPYSRVWLHMESYASLSKRSVLLLDIQSGINFNYGNSVMNEFSIGGLTNLFHNQVTFSGLRENSYYSNSLASMLVGLRYQLFSSVYLTGKVNALLSNFVSSSRFLTSPDFLSGYSLTFSYNFALGPLEVSVMYSDQWKRVLGYINIGIPF